MSGSLTGGRPLRVAMHVHGSWSEAVASWDWQFGQAAANGFDVLYVTDHDFRALVGAATPAAGSDQVLNPAKDVAAIWPDLVAMDNCFYGLSFVARSPKRTAVADIHLGSLTFKRTQNSAAHVIANQAAIVSAYRARYPAVTAYPQTEISKYLPDLNTFGIPQWFPDYSKLSTLHDTLYRQPRSCDSLW